MSKVADHIRENAEYGLSRLLQETFDLRTGSVGSILQSLLRAARLHLSMEVSFVSEFSGGRRVFRCVDQGEGFQLLKVGGSDPIDAGYCKKIVEGRLPELIRNAQELPEAREIPATRDLGIGAHLSVPIRLKDGTVFGTFCTFSFHADYSLNERDLALMRVFADIAATLVEEDAAKARLDEEKRQRILHLLQGDELTMVWQPMVDIASDSIIGVESLARFPKAPHPTPVEWFEEATSVGLAKALEARAVSNALRVLEYLPNGMFLTCNVSAGAFLEGAVSDVLEGMPLHRIVLEITEHDIIEDYLALSDALAPLRDQGLRLAVDDAGAGYASFRHVLRLSPDMIKLDMSLTRDIDTDISRRSLTASLVQFALGINSMLVAEGVETQAELDTLLNLGITRVQGFFLHRPMSLADVQRVLSRAD